MSVIIFDNEKDQIIETIPNARSLGIHHDFTAISYVTDSGEYDVKIVNHNPRIYITTN